MAKAKSDKYRVMARWVPEGIQRLYDDEREQRRCPRCKLELQEKQRCPVCHRMRNVRKSMRKKGLM